MAGGGFGLCALPTEILGATIGRRICLGAFPPFPQKRGKDGARSSFCCVLRPCLLFGFLPRNFAQSRASPTPCGLLFRSVTCVAKSWRPAGSRRGFRGPREVRVKRRRWGADDRGPARGGWRFFPFHSEFEQGPRRCGGRFARRSRSCASRGPSPPGRSGHPGRCWQSLWRNRAGGCGCIGTVR